MRNKHTVIKKLEVTCPWKDCGKTFFKTVTVSFVTNQKGDVIESRVV